MSTKNITKGEKIDFVTVARPMFCMEDIYTTLRELSRDRRGAWVFCALPFSQPGDVVTFTQYDSLSRIPDYYCALLRTAEYPRGAIGWQGKIVSFSASTLIREQNRGIGRD